MNDPASVARLFLALATVLVAARAAGWVARRCRQPQVIGEIIGGLLLGPSLLGLLAADQQRYLFAPLVVERLEVIAQVGLVLFMFLVGVNLDQDHLRGQGRRATVVSGTSIVVPCGLGFVVGLLLHSQLAPDTEIVGFAAFMGVAMSITAFPVLVRILQESGLAQTRLGALALACAAIDDVAAWGLLAILSASVGAGDAMDVAVTFGVTALWLAVMVGAVRPMLERRARPSLAVAVALAFVSAAVTEAIGIHAIFGAFVAGGVMPSSFRRDEHGPAALSAVTSAVMLPVFFVVVGLSTRIGVLDDVTLWLAGLAIVAVAVIGKFGGATVAARLVGEKWRDAATIGVLMNTRGLTELVILSVGLELGLIGDVAFTVMVIMALVTTMMAAPLLGLLGSRVGDVGPAQQAG